MFYHLLLRSPITDLVWKSVGSLLQRFESRFVGVLKISILLQKYEFLLYVGHDAIHEGHNNRGKNPLSGHQNRKADSFLSFLEAWFSIKSYVAWRAVFYKIED